MKESTKICIIDDDEIYRFAFGRHLKSLEATSSLQTFSESEMALDFFREYRVMNDELPDILFLDINMPIMGGFEFIEAFEKLGLTKKIDIYVMSSLLSEENLKQVKNYESITDYFTKPIGEDTLNELISRISNEAQKYNI